MLQQLWKGGLIMYKFLYNSQIHFASGFHEAMKQTGFALPEDVNPINYFIVRVWHWNESESVFIAIHALQLYSGLRVYTKGEPPVQIFFPIKDRSIQRGIFTRPDTKLVCRCPAFSNPSIPLTIDPLHGLSFSTASL